MRYLLAIIVLLGLWAWCPLGAAAQDSAERSPKELRFESTWPMKVWAADKSPKLLGTTPTPDGQGVLIPAHATWWVQPIEKMDDHDLEIFSQELLEHKFDSPATTHHFRVHRAARCRENRRTGGAPWRTTG